jgi:hypothetical protein
LLVIAAGQSKNAIQEQYLALARISTREKAEKSTEVSQAERNAKAMKQAKERDERARKRTERAREREKIETEEREKKAKTRAKGTVKGNAIKTKARNNTTKERVNRVKREEPV